MFWMTVMYTKVVEAAQLHFAKATSTLESLMHYALCFINLIGRNLFWTNQITNPLRA